MLRMCFLVVKLIFRISYIFVSNFVWNAQMNHLRKLIFPHPKLDTKCGVSDTSNNIQYIV